MQSWPHCSALEVVRVDINAGPTQALPLASHQRQSSGGHTLSNAGARVASVYRSAHQSHNRRWSGGTQQSSLASGCRSPPALDSQQGLTGLSYCGSKRSRSTSHSGTHTTGSSSGSHRSSGASLLCRCGSGGALLVPASSPPSNCLVYSRGAQSLPSTPNACRRPLSPSMRPLTSDASTAHMIGVGFADEPCYALYGTAPSTAGSDHIISESAVLNCNEDGEQIRPNAPMRALHHWTQQRRNLRYRASSQPLMKLSTLVIILLAFLIIGFIVLSPLFHYLMS